MDEALYNELLRLIADKGYDLGEDQEDAAAGRPLGPRKGAGFSAPAPSLARFFLLVYRAVALTRSSWDMAASRLTSSTFRPRPLATRSPYSASAL